MKLLKKSILLSLVAPLLFSLLSFTNAVADVIIIKVYSGINYESRIAVSSKDKTTVIALEKDKNAAVIDKNTEIVAGTLDQYLKDGYKIETSNSVHSTYGTQITTYILTK